MPFSAVNATNFVGFDPPYSFTSVIFIFTNGLKLNSSKCVQYMFTLKGNAVTDLEFKANINGNILSEVESVPYLGVTFSNNALLRTSLESAYVSPFLSRNFVGYQRPQS